MNAIWNCAQGLLSGLHATYLRNITHRDVSQRNRLKTGRWQPPPSKGGPRLTRFFLAVQRLKGPSTEIWPDVAAVEHWNAASPEFDPCAKTLKAVGAHGVSMFSTSTVRAGQMYSVTSAAKSDTSGVSGTIICACKGALRCWQTL